MRPVQPGPRTCRRRYGLARGGSADGDGDVSLHRYRELHATVGGTSRRDAARRSPSTTRGSAAAIEANGGYVVKTTGDGVHAAFGRAADAVAAAEQAQAAIADLPTSGCGWGSTPVRRRSATATTSARAVNRTARLMAAGHGGQVLLSAVTAELVPGLVVRNLGEHRLRDLGQPDAGVAARHRASSRRCARSTSCRATCRCSARASSAAPTK